MNISLRSSYRLVARGGEGLTCDENGLALGAVDLARVRFGGRGERRCQVRSVDEVGAVLMAAYGAQSEAVVQRCHRGLRRAAAYIEAGDLGRAGVEAVMLGLPHLTTEAAAKLAEIADLEKVDGAWENQPRVPAGQSGGGEWTTDAGGSTTNTSPTRTGSGMDNICDASEGFSHLDNGRLVHVNTAAVVGDGARVMGDIAVPRSVATLGRAGVLAVAAAFANQLDERAAQEQVNNAIAKFGLNPSRSADVIAASAYVWSRYFLPPSTNAPYVGPALNAASEAVMRFALVNPNAALAAIRGDSQSSIAVESVANEGVADYLSESRARPAGVDPGLQTTSRSARAAIAEALKDGRMQAHHLIPAYNWAEVADVATLAYEAGWRVDSPSNLIALPADEATQEEQGGLLPIHRGSHGNYNDMTAAFIKSKQAKFPKNITPLEARSVMEDVARINRVLIISGLYGKILKVRK